MRQADKQPWKPTATQQQEIDAHIERYMASPDTTADLLRQLHELKVTYKDIADKIGVTYMTIFRWAKGLSKPRPAKPVNDNLMFMLHSAQIDTGAMRLAKERAEADFKANLVRTGGNT